MASIDKLLVENNLMLKFLCRKLDLEKDIIKEEVPEVKTYLRGDDLKAEIKRLTELGISKRNIANQLNVSVATVSNYRRQIKLDEARDALEDIDDIDIFDDDKV